MNADDFGQSSGINRGVVLAHEHGIVTSASLMVRWPAAAAAARHVRERGGLDLGLHLDLGEWAYRDGNWVPLYEVVPLEDPVAVAEEAARQLAAFRTLVGRDPSHLDSHQHVHRRAAVRVVARDLARALGVPLRDDEGAIRYCGAFYGQTTEGTPQPDAITAERLVAILAGLPPGTTELACHPGDDDDLDTMYRAERGREVQALCDPGVRGAIEFFGISLCTFAGRPRGGPGTASGGPAREIAA